MRSTLMSTLRQRTDTIKWKLYNPETKPQREIITLLSAKYFKKAFFLPKSRWLHYCTQGPFKPLIYSTMNLNYKYSTARANKE